MTANKLKELGNGVLPFSPDPSPADYHFFSEFGQLLRGKLLTNDLEEKNAFSEFLSTCDLKVFQIWDIKLGKPLAEVYQKWW